MRDRISGLGLALAFVMGAGAVVAPFLLPFSGEEPSRRVRIGVMNLEMSNEQAGTLARSLLSTAIDRADSNPAMITETARADVEDPIEEHSLPADTPDRVKRRLGPLEQFPSMGVPLEGRWAGSRFLLGQWKWMLIVYDHVEAGDFAVVTTIQDARRAASVTSGG